MSQPPQPFPEPPAGRAFAWLPLVAAAVVFGGFLAYGLLAPATYRATAQVVLKPIGSAKLALPSAPSPVDRLRQTVNDAEALERVANALELGTGEAGQAAAKVHLDARLAVTAPRADTFEFTFDESTAERAERAANLLARHAATRTQNALTPPPPDEVTAREAARSKSAQELAAFMALHPELNPSTPSVVPVPPKDPKEASDAEGSALRAERDQIRAKLAQLPAAGDSDNPFGEANAAEGKRMRRRLAEIEQTLLARKRADKKSEATPKVAPEVEREWKRLLAATANPVVTERQAPPPTFTVMLREATRPTAPIEPDRRVLAVAGVIAAFVTALGLSVIQGRGARRQSGTAARAQYGSEPPRPRSDPPRQGSEPPRAGSDPPRAGSDPPRRGSEPPRTSSEPPRPASEPPRPGGDLLDASATPGLGQTVALPPQQILSIADTVVSPAAPRPASSNPPAEARRSSNPPAEARRSSNPPAEARRSGNPPVPTTTAPLLSPPPQVATAVGHPRPSPPPEAPSPPPPRPTPGYEELGKLAPAAVAVAKGTLLGMAPIDPRALAAAEDPLVEATEGPFAPAPSVREPNEPRSTLRPPPPGPAAATTEAPAARDHHRPEAPATATHLTPSPGEPDSSWTGPSRAHRRSMSAARRTTQMLGSPIPPVTRGSSRPPNERREQDEPRDGSDPPPQQPTTYSFVSTRPPEGPSPRPPTNTPPYYAQADGSANRRHPPSTPHPHAPVARAPAPRPRVTKHPLRAGWTPEASIDARLRRSLADELFPLAIEECLVIGVTSVGETRLQKSRVAAELALALAEPRHPRVLLLEGDFQSATLHRVMRIDMPLAAGFSQQLRAMGRSATESWTVVEVSPTLHVLTEGIMRSPGLILSVQFEESIRSLRSYYDLIVLDGPDSSSEVECRALSNVIDAVVLVAPASGSPDLARASLLFPEKRYSTVVGV